LSLTLHFSLKMMPLVIVLLSKFCLHLLMPPVQGMDESMNYIICFHYGNFWEDSYLRKLELKKNLYSRLVFRQGSGAVTIHVVRHNYYFAIWNQKVIDENRSKINWILNFPGF
jgi:hypothetical protein